MRSLILLQFIVYFIGFVIEYSLILNANICASKPGMFRACRPHELPFVLRWIFNLIFSHTRFVFLLVIWETAFQNNFSIYISDVHSLYSIVTICNTYFFQLYVIFRVIFCSVLLFFIVFWNCFALSIGLKAIIPNVLKQQV